MWTVAGPTEHGAYTVVVGESSGPGKRLEPPDAAVYPNNSLF